MRKKTGHGSTHVMGIIACQSGESAKMCKPISKVKVDAAEFLENGNFGDIILQYRPRVQSPSYVDLNMRLIPKIRIPVDSFEHLDLLWSISSRFCRYPPNWQGFMSKVVNGGSEMMKCTTVIYNPMIPLNPSTDDAVYSTMCFVLKQAKLAGLCCATLTFDQPLFFKCIKIKHDSGESFKHLFVRLGGFHQLMSFLGAGCKHLEAGGLEELWGTVYARDSLPKMIDGKAYGLFVNRCCTAFVLA